MIPMFEDRDFVDNEDKVLSIGPEAGQYMHDLCLKLGAKNILEVGMSHGYSTLWFADAVNGGKVVSVEKSVKKISLAQHNFERAGVSDVIEIVEGNAKEVLKSVEGPFDVVLLDARKDEYIEYFKLIFSKVRSGGIIIADNMFRPLSSRHFMEAYQEYVKGLSGVKSETISVGWGLEVSEKE